MKITIIGVGKVGKVLTEYLSLEGHDIVVIDRNAQLIEDSVNVYDVKGVVGNGASYDVQLEAEVNKADVLIATTDSDELNILCSLVGKKHGVKHTIARVRNPEYAKQTDFLHKELGVSMIVNPEQEAAKELYQILRFPSSTKIDFFAYGQAEIVEFKIKEDSPLIGKSLSTLRAEFDIRFLISTVDRQGTVHIPSGDFVLEQGDKVYVTASPSEIDRLFKRIGIFKTRSKNVMIVGGGKITYYLAKQLLEEKIKVKIIEFEKERCLELCDSLPDAIIVHADGSDQGVLLEEGLKDMDAFITLTGFDEENIIMSLYAESLKVPKVITKTNHHTYTNILEAVGLDSVISPKFITANHILRYVRSLGNTISQVRNLYKLVNNQIEAAEFYISEKTHFTNITFRELRFKRNVLIACIIRDNNVIIPDGEDCIKPKDSVVVVTTMKYLKSFDDVLKKG